jgi:hypothetical protein
MRGGPRIEQTGRVKRPKPPEHRDAQSDFFRDVGPNDQAGLATLGALLPTGRAPTRGAERLARAVAELPLRYAPFFRRLSGLWQISEDVVERELARARDPKSWTRTLLRGVKTFEVGVGQSGGSRARLLCFSAGLHFPKHRHRGAERVLVLEGSYADSTGCRVGAGEEQSMAAGTEHELHVLGNHDCIAAVAEQGMDFTGPWLRWASKLFG